MPSEKSLISLMLRATNKETGRGLTDKEVAAQVNTFMAAGECLSSWMLKLIVNLVRTAETLRQLLLCRTRVMMGMPKQ